MISGLEYALIALAVFLLIYSGFWTDRTYRRFEKIPAHYDIFGKATRLTSRRAMAWALPIGFSLMLIGLPFIIALTPAEYINGDPKTAVWTMVLGFLAGQGLVLWLLARWASRQV